MLVFIIVVLSNRIKVDLIGFSLCYVAQLDADEELIWVFGCGGGGGGGGGLEGGERGGTGAAGRRRRRRKWVKWTNANRLSEPTVVSIHSTDSSIKKKFAFYSIFASFLHRILRTKAIAILPDSCMAILLTLVLRFIFFFKFTHELLTQLN